MLLSSKYKIHKGEYIGKIYDINDPSIAIKVVQDAIIFIYMLTCYSMVSIVFAMII